MKSLAAAIELLKETGNEALITGNEYFHANTVLAAMLVEDTGKSFLDSGGYYGRHWEKNRKSHPATEPAVKLEMTAWEPPEFTFKHNIYHHLAARLDYSDELNDIFQKWYDKYQAELDVKDFAEAYNLQWSAGHTEDTESWFTGNFEFVYVIVNEDLETEFGMLPEGYYAILEIHGGCDLRGGYTEPTLFITDDYSDLLSAEQGIIGCSKCEFLVYEEELGGMDLYDINDENKPELIKSLKGYPTLDGLEAKDIEESEFLYYEEATEKIFCPFCGSEMTV